jgi:hypothetical protein
LQDQPDSLKPKPLSRGWRIVLLVAVTLAGGHEAYLLFAATTEACALDPSLGCPIATMLSVMFRISRNMALADLYIVLCLLAWLWEFTVGNYKR